MATTTKNSNLSSTAPNSTESQRAGVPRRLLALVYDLFLLLAISLAYGALTLVLRIVIGGDDALQQAPSGLLALGQLAGWWMVLALFYSWCWKRSGQTLGMKTWRLRLESENGGSVSWKQCWQRCAIAPIGLAACGIGYWLALFRTDRKTIADLLSHTRVTVLPKNG